MRGPLGDVLPSTCRGEGIQLSLDGTGGGGGARIGTKYVAFDTARCLGVNDLAAICANASSSAGGASIGAPGKSTLPGLRAMTALAFAEVSFSEARIGLEPVSVLSKKAWKPSCIVFGEIGGVSGKSPP